MKSIIRKVWNETRTVKTVVLELEKNMDFKAGQFVMISIPKNKFGKLIPARAYSIANAPNDRYEIKLYIKIYEDGRFSSYFNQLEEGDELEISGPFGRFILDDSNLQSINFIAAGTGIAPFFSMYEFSNKNNIKCNLIYSERTEEDIIGKKIIDDGFSNNLSGKYVITSKDSRINKEFIENNIIKSNLYFICGPPEFVNDIYDMLVELGVKEEKIKTERYG